MAYNNLGLTMMEQNKLNEALEQFYRAISARPTDSPRPTMTSASFTAK